MKNLLFFILLLFACMTVSAQTKHNVYGTVKNAEGKPLDDMYLYFSGTGYQAKTNPEGNFSLTVPAGKYTVICSGIGYQRDSISLNVNRNQNIDFRLKRNEKMDLADVTIKAKSNIQEVRESPYNVVSLNTKALYNTTLDLGHSLNQVSGVRIRETGGVGSNLSVTLNGFTGPHVKLFMDGVPMEAFSSAFQLNNIPVTIADRIDVYKGVVPIEYGTDAMGGVINIVTNQMPNYLDASYSYGSFNTHKSNVNFGYTSAKGFTVQLNAFQNYSDNNYRVFTDVLNLETGNYQNPQWVRRFNDAYHNETLIAKVGFVKKPWADRFLIGLTAGQERAEIQNANIMRIVFGQRERRANTLAPSLTYVKRNLFTDGLSFSLNASYNRNYNHNIDTAARQYNWLGEYRATRTLGESVYSLAKFYNKNATANANLTYHAGPKHSFVLNDVVTRFSRTNADDAALIDNLVENTERNTLKNILGASYRYEMNSRFNATAFGKFYTQRVTGSMDTNTTAGGAAEYAQQTKTYQTAGYGIAGTYLINDLQLKASVERAYRLPTENELFGDEVLEAGNAALKAENSLNYNLGGTYNHQINKNHVVYLDATVYYRNINDYIIRTTEARYGSAISTNHGKVRNVGIDAEARYYYKKLFMVGGTITYQDLRNKERYVSPTSTQQSVTYNDRVRNVPYFFGNADAAVYLNNVGAKGNMLTLGYTFNYVDKFYLWWESLGSADSKNIIPRQVYHDLNATYSVKNGRYNVSFEARNINDAILYDNFSLQKPGRSFAVKLRYFINTTRSH